MSPPLCFHQRMRPRKPAIPALRKKESAFTGAAFGNEPGMNPYLLHPDEIGRFDAAMGDDPFMRAIYEDAAAHWREHLRPRHKTAEACRWQFLQMISVRYGTTFPPGIRMEELPALARYLGMRDGDGRRGGSSTEKSALTIGGAGNEPDKA